jgi:hypothetical protein
VKKQLQYKDINFYIHHYLTLQPIICDHISNLRARHSGLSYQSAKSIEFEKQLKKDAYKFTSGLMFAKEFTQTSLTITALLLYERDKYIKN